MKEVILRLKEGCHTNIQLGRGKHLVITIKGETEKMHPNEFLSALKNQPEVSVLIVGGGISGIDICGAHLVDPGEPARGTVVMRSEW